MPSTSLNILDLGKLDSTSFLADTCVIHDLILRALEMSVDRSGNYPFQGRSIWDVYFYRKALMALPLYVTTSVHMATATADFTAPAIADIVSSLTVHEASGFNNRLHRFEKGRVQNRFASLLPPEGLAKGDSLILDNLVHFNPDPLAVLLSLRNALPKGARLLFALPMALDQTMNLYEQLGYVFLNEGNIRSLADESVSVNVFASGHSTSEWPQYSKVGVCIERHHHAN